VAFLGLAILSPKNMVFQEKKFQKKKKKRFYLFSMQLFSADPMLFSKK
jgi:hypothetical protein